MAGSLVQGGVQSLHKSLDRQLALPNSRPNARCFTPASFRTQKQSRRQELCSWVTQAAAVGDVDDLDDAEVEEQTAQVQKAAPEDVKFSLNLLWMENNIGLAVDQVYAPKMRSPLTEYYFWPKVDAWEELKTDLEGKPWVAARNRIILLNLATEVINFWQTDGKRPTVEEAREQFTNCIFRG